MLLQREDIHPLLRLAGRPCTDLAPLRHTDLLPVRRPVTGRFELRQIHKSLDQNRPQTVARLPIVGQLPNRHRQRPGGQKLHLNPGEDQKAAVVDHPIQPLHTRPLAPSDPLVAVRQRRRGRFKQQTAELTSVPVHDEVAQMRTERPSVAQIMIPVYPHIPFPNRARLRHLLQRERQQGLQIALNGWLHLRLERPIRLPERVQRLRNRPLPGQRQDT